MRPVVIFPDVEAWAVTWLRTALAARPEAYASGVTVATKVPTTIPARLVQVRRDGGPVADLVTAVPRLGVNVWAGSEEDATDLAALVEALLLSVSASDPVEFVRSMAGPSPIPDTKPRRYFTVEAITRGAVA